MAKKDENNLNITIKNQEDDEDKVIISFSTLFRKLKKYFLIWLVVAVVLIGAAFGYSAVITRTIKVPISAIVNFSYDGIEKGLDPNGRKFDVYSIKSPSVIEQSLTDLNFNLTLLEPIREGITIIGQLPKDVKERLTIYDEVIQQNGSVQAAEKILETSYFPTQYTVTFNYSSTGLSNRDAVEIFNKILDNYNDYFYELYGYNESLGSALTAISYTDYDYAEAVDVFNNSLDSMKLYVNDLAKEDNTRFRSSVTGYTFEDLYSSIDTVQSFDLDRISSFVTVNNITKDKSRTIAYYEYRVKTLSRLKDQLEEQLSSLEKSIQQYEKDQIIVFGNTDENSTQTSLASEEYDKMFSDKNDAASQLASTKQEINFYKDRLQEMKGKSNSNADMINAVETDLKTLSEKINNLVDLVCDTSEDYYKNVTFKNAYSVLVPATTSSSSTVNRVIDNAKMPLIILEALGILAYFAFSFIQALISDNKNKDKEKNKKKSNDENINDNEEKSSEKSESESENNTENEISE